MTAEARQRKGGGGYNPPYASIVVDVNSGKVLQATNPDAPRFPASVTKVMTLYMLFEQIERGKFRPRHAPPRVILRIAPGAFEDRLRPR